MSAFAEAAKRFPRKFGLCLIEGDGRDTDIIEQRVDLAAAAITKRATPSPSMPQRNVAAEMHGSPWSTMASMNDRTLRLVPQNGDQRRTVDDDQSKSPSLL